jgi:chromosome segregation ATPase
MDSRQNSVSQASGHYGQGSAVQGNVLFGNEVTATQVAIGLTEEKRQLTEELTRSRQINADLTARLANSNRELADANARIAQMQNELGSQIARNDQLQRDNDGLRTEKAELIEQSRMLVAAIEKTLDEILFSQLAPPATGGN